jgi:hypothetical protein
MSGFLGSGDLLFNRKINGIEQGWKPFGNATKFAIKENSEIKTRKSKQKSTYGQTLDSAPIKGDAEISISLDDINKDNLALAFLGTVVNADVTGASVTAEEVVANLDASFKTQYRKITNVVVKDDTDTTTYVIDTDYIIENAGMGLITPLSSGSIAQGVTLHLSYDYASITASKVKGGTDSSIRVALMLDGENFATQSDTLVNVWEAELSPQSEVDFLADDFTTLELAGTLTTPSGYESAYEVENDIIYS